MGIDIQKAPDSGNVTIRISGRFDFSMHKEFRNSYQNEDAGTAFVVNLGDTEYMDSSALGMLLLLKKYADSNGGRVTLTSPQENVSKVLEIANFDKVFDIK